MKEYIMSYDQDVEEQEFSERDWRRLLKHIGEILHGKGWTRHHIVSTTHGSTGLQVMGRTLPIS